MIVTAAALFGFMAYILASWPPENIDRLTSEGSTLETAAVVFYLIAALMGLGIVWKKRFSSRLWAVFTFAMFAAMGREMDLHKAFTDDSVLKSNFYADAAVPLVQKIGGMIFVLLLLFCAIYLIYTVFKRWRELWLTNTTAWLALCATGALVVGKTCDSWSRLFPFWQDLHHDYGVMFRLTEESFETAGAFLFMVCAVSALLSVKKPAQ